MFCAAVWAAVQVASDLLTAARTHLIESTLVANYFGVSFARPSSCPLDATYRSGRNPRFAVGGDPVWLALVVSQAAKRQPHWREVSSQHDGANFLPGPIERRLRR
jgi:hypothetical protein